MRFGPGNTAVIWERSVRKYQNTAFKQVFVSMFTLCFNIIFLTLTSETVIIVCTVGEDGEKRKLRFKRYSGFLREEGTRVYVRKAKAYVHAHAFCARAYLIRR